MLTPEELLVIIDSMQPIIDGLNVFIVQDIVDRIVARLERGEPLSLSGTDDWQIKVYQEAGGHLDKLKAELQKFLKASDAEIQAIFEEAAIRSVEVDTEVYKAAGVPVPENPMSERMIRILADTYKRTGGEVRNFSRSTAEASQRRFTELLDEAHIKVMTGVQSYSEAVSDVVDALCDKMPEVLYPSGHRDTLETAVTRAVRTGVAQACGSMSLQQMDDFGWDLIRVSAHLGARYGDGGENPGNHAWWQGKLFSKSGTDPKYPPFSETGYGTGEGLCGWNCRHSFGPGDPNHNPYADYDKAENKKAFDLSQKQRRREAAIRRTKLKMIGLTAAIDGTTDIEQKGKLKEEYTKLAKKLARQNAEYSEFCKANGLRTMSDRTHVGGWTRGQTRRSIAAAKS